MAASHSCQSASVQQKGWCHSMNSDQMFSRVGVWKGPSTKSKQTRWSCSSGACCGNRGWHDNGKSSMLLCKGECMCVCACVSIKGQRVCRWYVLCCPHREALYLTLQASSVAGVRGQGWAWVVQSLMLRAGFESPRCEKPYRLSVCSYPSHSPSPPSSSAYMIPPFPFFPFLSLSLPLPFSLPTSLSLLFSFFSILMRTFLWTASSCLRGAPVHSLQSAPAVSLLCIFNFRLADTKVLTGSA